MMCEVIMAKNNNSVSSGWSEEAIPMLENAGYTVWKEKFYYFDVWGQGAKR